MPYSWHDTSLDARTFKITPPWFHDAPGMLRDNESGVVVGLDRWLRKLVKEVVDWGRQNAAAIPHSAPLFSRGFLPRGLSDAGRAVEDLRASGSWLCAP